VQMVAVGMGLTLLPELAVDAGITRGLDIKLVPLSDAISKRGIGLVWRKSSPRAEEYRLLGDILMKSRKKRG
jgi:LysR family transcriptional regulator, hydrogen peroxide-inducible genes activator